ncbi:MAG TPA: transglycosylase domain-containing protein, partial [Propionibacteriaceae bacterium]|nr:transglycosylase domain-containing protein [Propionibacteriaceae bacterium]
MGDPQWGPVEKHPPGAGARPGRPPRTPAQRRALFALKGLGISLALILVAGFAVVFIGYTTTERPDPNAEFQTATTGVYYNDGTTRLGRFEVQNRTPLTFEQMPDTMKQAIVAAENRTFWTDRGISIRGMIRAGWAIARGENLQGGSTITQQYIKILYLNSERTLTRKFREIFLAYKLSKELTKEQILEGYLNTIYFGHGAYGLQAASRAYFSTTADDLTVPQAAFLSTVVNNPTAYDPEDEDNRDRILERYRYVIQSMLEMGYITEVEAAKYSQDLPKFPERASGDRFGGPKGFLLKMVERELTKAGFESSQISGGGLKVITTFDKKAQDAAVEAAQKYTRESAKAADEKASNLHAAVASVDVDSGEVLALYGGPDYVKNSRNWATTPRPTASTFKTYALAAALEDGYSLYSRFNGNTFTPPGDSSPVRNEFSNQYGSAVPLLRGTALSINTVFVDLVTSMDNGAKKTMDMAEAAGAPKGAGWDDNSRLPLGTAEVSPLAQASAYATFANDGVRVPEHVVREVRSRDGEVLYKAAPEEKRAVSEEIAADVNFALSSVVDSGTGRVAQDLDRPVAGKTGTKDREDDIVSAWFVGYTKQISTAVMYVAGKSGNDDLDPYARPGDSTFFGGTYPALTWADYMAVATEGQPVEDFGGPAYVNRDKYSEPTLSPEPTQTREPTEEPTEIEEPEPDPTTSSPEPEPTETNESEP